MIRQRPLIPILIVLTAGCASGSRESECSHSFAVVNENGIRIAENSATPRYPGELFTYEEVLRLNQDESNPESLLAYPRIVLTDEVGNFYLDDVRDNRIVSFDASR